MGLETIEIVLRTEEVFAIELPDDECGTVRTVGDLYCLVLKHLNLSYATPVSIHLFGSTIAEGRSWFNENEPALTPWTASDVWATLVELIQDQLQVDPQEITEHATFLEDLGCD